MKLLHKPHKHKQYTLDYSHLSNDFKMKSIAFHNRANKTALQDNAADNFTSLNRKEQFKNIYNTGLDIQGTYFKWESLNITLGGSYKYIHLNYDVDYADSERDAGALGNQQHISPFLFADLKFLENTLLFNLVLRYDYIQTSDAKNWDKRDCRKTCIR